MRQLSNKAWASRQGERASAVGRLSKKTHLRCQPLRKRPVRKRPALPALLFAAPCARRFQSAATPACAWEPPWELTRSLALTVMLSLLFDRVIHACGGSTSGDHALASKRAEIRQECVAPTRAALYPVERPARVPKLHQAKLPRGPIGVQQLCEPRGRRRRTTRAEPT